MLIIITVIRRFNYPCRIKSRKNKKVIAPARNPAKASQAILRKYQKKSIFSIPIATTPAAEPIMSILPPVPAE